jgi:ABC-type transport system substrate-binding protein
VAGKEQPDKHVPGPRVEYRQLAEALQGMLREVNIRLKFGVIDVSQYTQFSRPVPRGDMMIGRNGGRGDAVEGLAQIVGTGGGVNPGGAATPRIDALLDEAKRLQASDPKRVEIMLVLTREISEQVGNIPSSRGRMPMHIGLGAS